MTANATDNSTTDAPTTSVSFALLGDDPRVLPLIEAIGRKKDLQLTHGVALAEQTAAVMALAPQVNLLGDVDELLTLPTSTVLILATADEHALFVAKRLAGDGHPLLLFPRRAHGDGFAYELLLVRDETAVPLFAASAMITDPQITKVLAGDVQPIQHLQFERTLQPADNSSLLSPVDIETAMIADLPVLLRLGGAFTRVTAVHSHVGESGIATATLTLAGENVPDTLWTLKPTTSQPVWTLRISRESVTQEIQGDALNNGEQTGNALLQSFLSTLPVGSSAGATVAKPREHRQSWNELIAVYEILDASRRSLRRGRTIELHYEETSERSQFKTQMTAIGCGVLLLTMFAFIGLLLIGAALDTRSVVERRAATENAIFVHDDFVKDSPAFSESAATRWQDVATRAVTDDFPVVVAASDDPALDTARRDWLVADLHKRGMSADRDPVEVIELAPAWKARVMIWSRVLVFVPLFIYLGLQLLVFLARPAV